MKTGIYWQDPKYALKPGRDFIFDPSLVLYLPLHKLDGASIMSRDAYGHLCTVGGALWTPGGTSFDGADDTIRTTDNLPFSGADHITMEAWVKSDDVSVDHKVAFCTPYDGGDTHRLAIRHTSGNWKIYAYYDGAHQDLDTGVIATTNWTHLVLLYDGAIKLYVNGELGYAGSSKTIDLVADEFMIGTYINQVNATYCWAGLIGEVRVYWRDLTPQEIQHNYLATKWRYQ